MTEMIKTVINKAERAAVELLAEALKHWEGSWNIDVDIDQEDFLGSGGLFTTVITHVTHGSFDLNMKYTEGEGLTTEWRDGCYAPADPQFYILWLDSLRTVKMIGGDLLKIQGK